ncbi:PLP-dependent decarboxylase [Bacteriovoracaceae bacterium]|nr:PLP-dependent decarboxylase [Bacteriovoracaceae bacterium]
MAFIIKDEHRTDLEKTIKRLDSSFFFYDLDALKEHLEHLSTVMDKDIRLWYACKANPLSAILKIFRNLGFGLDVASKGELDHVLSSGIKASEVIATGPSKSRKYMRELLKNDVKNIVCESINQVKWLNEAANELNVRPQVLLRLQLEWNEGKSVLGGDDITPFGEDYETWSQLNCKDYPHIDINGLHIFQWGNIMDISQLKKIWWKIAQTSKDLAQKIDLELKVLDLGGGIGIPYDLATSPVQAQSVNEALIELKEKFQLKKVWMELGRYAVGPFGKYFTQVIDRKTVRGREILVTDGGINHIVRPAITNQSFPAQMFRKSEKENGKFFVHGPLCTAIDFLGEFDLPTDINEGDWLCFHQAGAYGFTEAMPFFLCHNLPAEVIMYQGDFMTPRTPKTSTDWLV